MPTKQLTIDIPEPDSHGRCSNGCPLYDREYGNCNIGLDTGPGLCSPGPGCPQYQGDQSCPKKT